MDIETRLRQGPEIVIAFSDLEGLLPVKTLLFHRTDYHEDESQSEYYGIELTEEQFKLVKKTVVNRG